MVQYRNGHIFGEPSPFMLRRGGQSKNAQTF
jgi:hypothetical protein